MKRLLIACLLLAACQPKQSTMIPGSVHGFETCGIEAQIHLYPHHGPSGGSHHYFVAVPKVHCDPKTFDVTVTWDGPPRDGNVVIYGKDAK